MVWKICEGNWLENNSWVPLCRYHMSEEKASQLSINIGKRVRYYAVYFTIIILFVIWGDNILTLITSTISSDPQKSEWAQKLIASLVTALGAGAFLVMNLGRDIDLHNLIDKWLFHVRHNTNPIIINEMIKSAQKINADGCKNMENNLPEVRRLFYHFVNEQEKLRALAFTYWEQYFVNIYILSFGALCFLVSMVCVLLRWKFDIMVCVPLIFLLIISVVAISTRYSLIPKIYELPLQQIEEIHSSHPDEFKKQVQARFAGFIIP
jgi:hypothetical protein